MHPQRIDSPVQDIMADTVKRLGSVNESEKTMPSIGVSTLYAVGGKPLGVLAAYSPLPPLLACTSE